MTNGEYCLKVEKSETNEPHLQVMFCMNDTKIENRQSLMRITMGYGEY